MLCASLDGRGVWERMDTCICMTESLCCSLETTTTLLIGYQIRSDQSLSRVQLFVTPWITARQASLSITNSQSLPKLMSIESVMPSSLLILWATRGSLKIYTMGQCRRLGTEALYAWFAFCWLDLMTFQEDWLWKNSFVITDITALFLLQLWNSGLHGIGYQFLICS